MARSLNPVAVPNPLVNRNNCVKPNIDLRQKHQFSFRLLGDPPNQVQVANAPDELSAVQMIAAKLRRITPYPDQTLVLYRPKMTDGKWVVNDHSTPRFVGCK